MLFIYLFLLGDILKEKVAAPSVFFFFKWYIRPHDWLVLRYRGKKKKVIEAGVWELSDSDYKLLFLERSEFRFECDVCQAKPAVPQDRALYASLIR